MALHEMNSFADRAVFVFLLLALFPSEFCGDYGREMEPGPSSSSAAKPAREKTELFASLGGDDRRYLSCGTPRNTMEMFRQDGGYALCMMRQNLGFNDPRGTHPCSWYRREYGDLQRGEWRTAASAAVLWTVDGWWS